MYVIVGSFAEWGLNQPARRSLLCTARAISWTSPIPSALAETKNAAAARTMTRTRLRHFGQKLCTAQSASRKCVPDHDASSSTAEASASFESSASIARDSSLPRWERMSAYRMRKLVVATQRSEERRVGKGSRSGYVGRERGRE